MAGVELASLETECCADAAAAVTPRSAAVKVPVVASAADHSEPSFAGITSVAVAAAVVVMAANVIVEPVDAVGVQVGGAAAKSPRFVCVALGSAGLWRSVEVTVLAAEMLHLDC